MSQKMGAFSLDFGQKCDFQFSKINRIVECSVGATCGKTIRSKVIKGKKADCQLLNLFRISETRMFHQVNDVARKSTLDNCRKGPQ